MKKYRKQNLVSILTSPIAHNAYLAIPETSDRMPKRIKHKFFDVEIQHCFFYRWRGVENPKDWYTYTGGIKISVSGQHYPLGFKRASSHRRLRPGWTEQQFKNAVMRCIIDVRVVERERSAQVALYLRFQDLDLGEDALEKIEAYAETADDGQGWPILYDEMTIADCDRWQRWIDENYGTEKSK